MIRAVAFASVAFGCAIGSTLGEPCMPDDMLPGGEMDRMAEECQARVRRECGPPPPPMPDGSPDVAAIQKREQCPALIECDQRGEERCR